MSKQIVKNIIDTVGAERIMSKLGVTIYSIRHARREGRFASGWYVPLRDMCEEVGVECPENLFTWKTPSSKGADNAHGE